MPVNIKLEGGDEMLAKIKALGKGMFKKAGAALHKQANFIMRDSKANYCPVDTGNLRASGHVSNYTAVEKDVFVELGYGGPAAPYALKVHEIPMPHPVGEDKYLEKPMNAAVPTLADKIAKDLKLK